MGTGAITALDPAMVERKGLITRNGTLTASAEESDPLDTPAGAVVQEEPVPAISIKRRCSYCERTLAGRSFPAPFADTCTTCSRFDKACSLAPFGDASPLPESSLSRR